MELFGNDVYDDWSFCVMMSFKVTENIMTVESLLELPHKLLMGNLLLPDMDQVVFCESP